MKAFKKAKKDKKLKLTDEVIKKICNNLRAGAYVETAVISAGICKQTFYLWLKKGQDKPYSIYARFIDAVEKATAEAEMRDLFNIDQAAMGRKIEYERDENQKLILDKDGNPIVLSHSQVPSWQASAWRLERKNPRKWGRLDRLEAAGTNIGPQVVLMIPDNGRSSDENES